ncbi:unnamed protein product [Macrosiphum euphorbiae]|uniref:Uncharacterized protein n=1 Tax=Macrosiphum euphorbiae TaxID=13131 RepID=A0AAV0XRY1_9HEMI|nr:unnamed protein product [Macrosiphum euphorbiae]
MESCRWQIRAAAQLMGPLPAARVNPSPALYVTGFDCAGPISKRHGEIRSRVLTKAPFVCFSTRAIHLELRKADLNPFQQWDEFYRSQQNIGWVPKQ